MLKGLSAELKIQSPHQLPTVGGYIVFLQAKPLCILKRLPEVLLTMRKSHDQHLHVGPPPEAYQWPSALVPRPPTRL